ncbi:HNH endonuclease [Loigolactobacillus bifermentans]|uniref:HNH nuclease domain-containing protein n=1 Tax=Loigolactobacillus bifermentans DSM 20003 TaxID=1423726 RepID=A0A0R1H2V0_9LACO|nr:HNH endonuclease [Loigolactobacillus bifermentans]KRK40345.1 hypothetical protein FC07_GL000976 [Loigolactobacillus bifermentans DSM 20003]QGG59476.1 HNH endonuclease [Loigolactobacillus bifermentans]
MQAFIVMQGRTYQAEKQAGLIWTYLKDRQGQVPPTWARLKTVKPDDVIFHYVGGEIVAMSRVLAPAEQRRLPVSLAQALKLTQRPQIQQVALQYYPLHEPLVIQQILPLIAPYFPKQHAAFQQDGNGNQGYLYPCYSPLCRVLIDQIEARYLKPAQQQLRLSMSNVALNEDPVLRFLLQVDLLDRQQEVTVQQQFRHNVWQTQVHQCALCGIETPYLLVAARFKPRQDLDDLTAALADNGILLCRNHAQLLAHGLIGFSRGGYQLTAAQLPFLERQRLLSQPQRLNLTPAQRVFMNWHRNYIFKG